MSGDNTGRDSGSGVGPGPGSGARLAGEQLIDAPLVGDPDAERELNVSPAEALSDDEIRGARFSLVRRGVERVQGDGFSGLAVALDAYFHPAPGTHFSDAEIRINLTQPAGTVFADVAPAEWREPEPVRFKIERSATLGITAELAKAGLGRTETVEYTRYYCRIRGSGAGHSRARWTLEENEKTGEGVGQVSRLVLTLAGDGPFAADLLMRCQLVRPGIAGVVDRVRELILGPQLTDGRLMQFTIAPAESSKGGWFD